MENLSLLLSNLIFRRSLFYLEISFGQTDLQKAAQAIVITKDITF